MPVVSATLWATDETLSIAFLTRPAAFFFTDFFATFLATFFATFFTAFFVVLADFLAVLTAFFTVFLIAFFAAFFETFFAIAAPYGLVMTLYPESCFKCEKSRDQRQAGRQIPNPKLRI